MLTITEVFLDGTERVFPAYRVKNPTSNDIIFGSGQATGRDANGRQVGGARGLFMVRESCVHIGQKPESPTEKLFANRFLHLTILAGAMVLVAQPWLNELLIQRCTDCALPFRFARGEPQRRAKTFCSDESHMRMVVAGLAPQLLVLDDGERVVHVPVDRNLTDAAPAPRLNIAEIEARVLARMAAEKSGGAQ